MKKLIRYSIATVMLLASLGEVLAQANDAVVLTVSDAINLALEKNQLVQIARNTREINANNAIPGNARLLPDVYVDGGYSGSRNDSKVNFASPEQPPIDVDGAAATNTDIALVLSYNIFEGGAKYYRFQSLKKVNEIAYWETRNQIEQIVLGTLTKYLDAIRLKEQEKIVLESVALSRERLDRAESKYLYGAFTKVQVSNAEVNYNNDSATAYTARLNYENSLRDLNVFIGLPIDSVYEVPTNVVIKPDLQWGPFYEAAMTGNSGLVAAQRSVENSMLALKTERAARYPRLDLQASYGYNRNTNDASFVASSNSLGLNGGLRLTYNIYNGNRINTAIQNAKISQYSEELNYDFVERELERDLRNVYEQYLTDLSLLDLQEDNLETAQLNYDRSFEAYLNGQLSNTDLRDAQLNLILLKNEVNNIQISIKFSELNLVKLSGQLLEPGT